MTGNGTPDIKDFIRNLHVFNFLTRHNLETIFLAESTSKSISFVQMNLMKVLSQHPGQTVGNIARFMNVSYPAATKTIDKLVRIGFLTRKEDTRDRRIAHLYLTPAGQKVVTKYTEYKAEQIKAVLDQLGAEKATNFNRQLFDFARTLVDIVPSKERPCIQCGAFDPDDCIHTDHEESCSMLGPEYEPRAH